MVVIFCIFFATATKTGLEWLFLHMNSVPAYTQLRHDVAANVLHFTDIFHVNWGYPVPRGFHLHLF